ncbi:MAG: hypothetical protein NTV34_05335, partial [Proteobacteria bacterium]|nr:hypothetical protein [Pseudomonadota bacterium]
MTKTVDSIQRNRDLSDERCLLRKIIFLLATLALLGAKAHKGKRHHAAFKPIERPEPVAEESFDQILKSYQFIADFNEKPPERAISGEIFWRYPFRLAPQKFPLILEKGNLDAMIFRVPGEGRLAEHFAKGRVEYLAGNYDSAHATWLSARQTFDKDPLTNKRLEFFLAVTAAQVLREQWTLRKGNLADPELRRMINRLGY